MVQIEIVLLQLQRPTNAIAQAQPHANTFTHMPLSV